MVKVVALLVLSFAYKGNEDEPLSLPEKCNELKMCITIPFSHYYFYCSLRVSFIFICYP